MALALLLIFILVAIAGRMLLQYILTGDHGFRAIRRTSSGIEKTAGALFAIAFFGTIATSGLFIFNAFSLNLKFGIYVQYTGIFLCIAGIILTSVSQIQMGKSWRIGVDQKEKTDLITHGIYSVIRNPIYLGIILFGLGLLILVPHFSMMFFTALAYIAIELYVRTVEEPCLTKLHGKKYTHYVNTTGRYLPIMLIRGSI